MAEIAIGEAIAEGFRTITRRPWAVLIWGAVQVVVAIAPLLLLWPMFSTIFGAGSAPPDPMRLAAQAGQFQGLSLLMNVVQLLVSAVLTMAAFRSVLRPDQASFGYLRLDAAELLFAVFLFAATIALGIMFFVGLFIPVVIGAAMFATNQDVTSIITAVVLALVFFGVVIWLALRLSMVGPLLVDEGQLKLGEAWGMTRGKALALLAIGLVMLVIVLVVEIVVGLVLIAIGLSVVLSAGGGPQHVQELLARARPDDFLRWAIPVVAVYLLVMIPLGGAVLALITTPFARVYLQLRPERASDLSEAFS